MVEHSLGKIARSVGNGRESIAQSRGNRPGHADGNPEPSPIGEGVETRRATPKVQHKSDQGEGMVQRTNAACGGRESVSVMKGEVDSSILSGSTIFARC